MYNFFFKCSAHHRDLHSFPTRRSSDLHGKQGSDRRSPGNLGRRRQLVQRVYGKAKRCSLFGKQRLALPRSEEHTSELQSPYDLVCRLLLEKKKKNRYLNKTFIINNQHI